jgi:hypothetical protein
MNAAQRIKTELERALLKQSALNRSSAAAIGEPWRPDPTVAQLLRSMGMTELEVAEVLKEAKLQEQDSAVTVKDEIEAALLRRSAILRSSAAAVGEPWQPDATVAQLLLSLGMSQDDVAEVLKSAGIAQDQPLEPLISAVMEPPSARDSPAPDSPTNSNAVHNQSLTPISSPSPASAVPQAAMVQENSVPDVPCTKLSTPPTLTAADASQPAFTPTAMQPTTAATAAVEPGPPPHRAVAASAASPAAIPMVAELSPSASNSLSALRTRAAAVGGDSDMSAAATVEPATSQAISAPAAAQAADAAGDDTAAAVPALICVSEPELTLNQLRQAGQVADVGDAHINPHVPDPAPFQLTLEHLTHTSESFLARAVQEAGNQLNDAADWHLRLAPPPHVATPDSVPDEPSKNTLSLLQTTHDALAAQVVGAVAAVDQAAASAASAVVQATAGSGGTLQAAAAAVRESVSAAGAAVSSSAAGLQGAVTSTAASSVIGAETVAWQAQQAVAKAADAARTTAMQSLQAAQSAASTASGFVTSAVSQAASGARGSAAASFATATTATGAASSALSQAASRASQSAAAASALSFAAAQAAASTFQEAVAHAGSRARQALGDDIPAYSNVLDGLASSAADLSQKFLSVLGGAANINSGAGGGSGGRGAGGGGFFAGQPGDDGWNKDPLSHEQRAMLERLLRMLLGLSLVVPPAALLHVAAGLLSAMQRVISGPLTPQNPSTPRSSDGQVAPWDALALTRGISISSPPASVSGSQPAHPVRELYHNFLEFTQALRDDGAISPSRPHASLGSQAVSLAAAAQQLAEELQRDLPLTADPSTVATAPDGSSLAAMAQLLQLGGSARGIAEGLQALREQAQAADAEVARWEARALAAGAMLAALAAESRRGSNAASPARTALGSPRGSVMAEPEWRQPSMALELQRSVTHSVQALAPLLAMSAASRDKASGWWRSWLVLGVRLRILTAFYRVFIAGREHTTIISLSSLDSPCCLQGSSALHQQMQEAIAALQQATQQLVEEEARLVVR